MKSLRNSIVITFSLICLSCTPESLFISVEPSEPQIAVASLVAENLMAISLSRSFSPLSAEDIDGITDDFAGTLLLDSASVTIRYNGIIDTLLSLTPGLFFTELTESEDFQVMELTVFDSTTSETASALSVLLPAVELQSAELSRRDTTQTYLSDFNYTIADPEEENFYVLHVYQLALPDSVSDDSTDNELFFEDDNVLVYEQIFTDRSAVDGIIEREAVFDFTSPVDSAIVVLTNIEEGYYNFLEARSRSGSLVASVANEPINHPTNVENGVGYFSAHQPRGRVVTVLRNEEF